MSVTEKERNGLHLNTNMLVFARVCIVYTCRGVCVYKLAHAVKFVCENCFPVKDKIKHIVFMAKCVWDSEEVDLMMISYGGVVIDLLDNSRKSLCNGQ